MLRGAAGSEADLGGQGERPGIISSLKSLLYSFVDGSLLAQPYQHLRAPQSAQSCHLSSGLQEGSLPPGCGSALGTVGSPEEQEVSILDTYCGSRGLTRTSDARGVCGQLRFIDGTLTLGELQCDLGDSRARACSHLARLALPQMHSD